MSYFAAVTAHFRLLQQCHHTWGLFSVTFDEYFNKNLIKISTFRLKRVKLLKKKKQVEVIHLFLLLHVCGRSHDVTCSRSRGGIFLSAGKVASRVGFHLRNQTEAGYHVFLGVKLGLICREAPSSRFSSHILDYRRILSHLQGRDGSFRGGKKSSAMGNMILMVLLVLHLPTGEAFKRFKDPFFEF